jgi:hypothetical protein
LSLKFESAQSREGWTQKHDAIVIQRNTTHTNECKLTNPNQEQETTQVAKEILHEAINQTAELQLTASLEYRS